MPKIVLITGTDTGVGKTVLTALLLRHLRQRGRQALAIKPFCCGSRRDARLLHALQKQCLTLGQTNPFYFPQPLAPWVAAKKQRRQIPFAALEEQIRAGAGHCEILLVEGAGGVLAPLGSGYPILGGGGTPPSREAGEAAVALGSGYSMADLAVAFRCPTIVVARNRLGTINHTLLSVRYLQTVGVEQLAIVLMEAQKPDLSARSNARSLAELLPQRLPSPGFARGGEGLDPADASARRPYLQGPVAGGKGLDPVPVFCLPFLGQRANTVEGIKKNEKKLKKHLQPILEVLC